jgi:uncharacterized protein YecE (DUF72 family)
MAEIFIGTSGFYYDDWKGLFYPDELKKTDYLGYYASQFNIVELNFTYYRLPEPHQIKSMIEKAEDRLQFIVKAYRGITHEISGNSIDTILPRYMDGITPLIEEELLGAILLQFPQGFHYTPNNRVYLKHLLEAIRPFPLCVEFRNKEWLRDSVYSGLRDLGAGFVCVDEPDLPDLIPAVSRVTSEIGYIRFHGRNKINWYETDSTSRYDYLYSEEELKEWLPRIMEISRQTKKLFIFFNNHAKSQAITNARMLINLLR